MPPLKSTPIWDDPKGEGAAQARLDPVIGESGDRKPLEPDAKQCHMRRLHANLG